MKEFAIIVAGGSGTRMGKPLPKQYLEIGGRPILMHTLSRFHQYSTDLELILVIPETDFSLWKELCHQFQFQIPHRLVKGGNSRFHSVKNGLNAINEHEGMVAIHDGVRPFVTREMIGRGFDEAKASGSAVATIPLKDSIRKTGADGSSRFQKREEFRLVQTPQIFELGKIKKAFDVEEQSHFTDDATVYEYQGWAVKLFDGDVSNIKITTPEDIDFAEFLLGRASL